jgi:parallel beta-helix repeat protein
MKNLARLALLLSASQLPACQTNGAWTTNDEVEDAQSTALASPVLEVFVSPGGKDDTGKGTRAEPFASLGRARAAVAEKRGALRGNIVVWLSGGLYEQSAPLVLNESDGGNGTSQVIYKARPGERPVIMGGRRLTGWQPHTANIYRAALPKSRNGMWDLEVLTENEVMSTKARSPNRGYWKTTGGVKRTLLKAAPGTLPAWTNIADAQAVLWAGHDWFANTAEITKMDTSTGEITLGSETAQGISADNRFFLQGTLEALDEPGEFHVDRQAGVIYYWPRARPIESQVIFGATSRELVTIKGRSAAAPVTGLRFEGIHFVGANFGREFREHDTTWNQPGEGNRYGLISLENAHDVEIVGNEITGAGYSCVALRENTERVTLKYNHIHHCGYHGVLSMGASVGTVENGAQVVNNHHHTITGNHIHHVGRLVGHSAGIFLFQSGNNTITRNEIHNSPRYGICMKGSPRWDI